jgi:predicted hydrocarbon binding protein
LEVHGLVFVTWEKFLLERFGTSVLGAYREAIGGTEASVALVSRIYDDALLLKGVAAVTKVTGKPANILLREYGRYFLNNSLTNRLCTYILTRVNNARDLLLMMRTAHAQMRRTADTMVPPVFMYEALSDNPNELLLTYDSHRQLCPVLCGCIEGAADRFGEKVVIVERTCMQQGASACLLEIRFYGLDVSKQPVENRAMQIRHHEQKHIADTILRVLPFEDGVTLQDLETLLRVRSRMPLDQIRPSILLSAVSHLQHAGLVTSTANMPGDILPSRRFWRVHS